MNQQILMEIKLYIYFNWKNLYRLEGSAEKGYKLRNLETKKIEFVNDAIELIEQYLKLNLKYSVAAANWYLRKYLRLFLNSHDVEYDSFSYQYIKIKFYENSEIVIKDFYNLEKLVNYSEKHFNFSLDFIDDYICSDCGKLYSDVEVEDNCILYNCNCGNRVVELL